MDMDLFSLHPHSTVYNMNYASNHMVCYPFFFTDPTFNSQEFLNYCTPEARIEGASLYLKKFLKVQILLLLPRKIFDPS